MGARRYRDHSGMVLFQGPGLVVRNRPGSQDAGLSETERARKFKEPMDDGWYKRKTGRWADEN